MNTKTQVAPAFHPHVAVINGAIKTTSLKVAEHFGKRHDHVTRDIEKIISQTTGIADAPKFGESEYEYKNNLGLLVKAKMYEMDKDGFVLLVMGYNGVKAMGVKIAYINAFNQMANELYQQPTIHLQLPEPPTISKAQQGELFTIVANKARSSGKPNAYYWSRYQNHFHLSSYKLTQADKFDEARDYLDRLEGENNPLLTLSQDELEILIAERVKALDGELLPKDEATPTDTITISLNNGIRMMNIVFGGTADTVQRYSVSVDKEFLSIHQMDNKLMADVLKDQGYIVFDKTGVSARQIVMHHIPPQFLPDMIEEAGAMLRRINEGKKLD